MLNKTRFCTIAFCTPPPTYKSQPDVDSSPQKQLALSSLSQLNIICSALIAQLAMMLISLVLIFFYALTLARCSSLPLEPYTLSSSFTVGVWDSTGTVKIPLYVENLLIDR